MIAGAIALVALLFSPWPGKGWRLFPPGTLPSTPREVDGAPTPAAPGPSQDSAAFDRVIIRNIGTVPFVEIFDLIRAATPERRAAWIKQLDEMPHGPQRKAALFSFYKTFVQIDAHAAAASIDSLHDTNTKAYAVESMTSAAPLSAMGEMATLLARMPPDIFSGARNVIGSVIYDWSTVDPPAVAKFFDAHPDMSAQYNFALLANWAQLDPDAARAWFDQLPETAQTEKAISGLMDGWFRGDEPNALAFMVAHGSDEKFSNIISYVSGELFLRSPAEARNFLLQLPSEGAMNAAMNHIAKITNGSPIPGSRGLEQPPDEVARWMLTFPKESWDGAMVTVLDSWERQNITGLSNWMNQLPAETHDDVVAQYCASPSMETPDRALAMGLTIRDATLRERTLRELMNRWMPDSRAEAVEALKGLGLSAAQKEYLANLIPRE